MLLRCWCDDRATIVLWHNSGGTGGVSGGFGSCGRGSGGGGESGGSGSGGGRSGATQHGGSGGGQRQQQQRRSKTPSPQQLRERFSQRGASRDSDSCPYVIRTGDRAGQTCGKPHSQNRCFSRLDDAWRAEFGDEAKRPRWAELHRSGVAIFDLDYDAIHAAMYALSVSAEGDYDLCVPLLGIEAAALGNSESALSGSAPAVALHTFTLDSGASRCFFSDSTNLTPLSAPIPVRLADPSGGPVLASSSSVLSCPAVLFGSLSGLHLPSFSSNLVSTAALQDTMVTTTTPGGQRVLICTRTRTGRPLATFTRRPGSSLYTLATEPPQIAASAQVFASGLVAPPCSCRLLSHQTLLRHHRLGHHSLQRLRVLLRPLAGLFSWGGHSPIVHVLDSPQQNGIAERRIGVVMEVACTSMIHAAAPHFLWPFAVWGSRAFVRDTSADKLSHLAIPCVFLGFPPDAPDWQFYHPTSRCVFPSQDITFDKSVPFSCLFPDRCAPPSPPPLFLALGPPPIDPLPPQGTPSPWYCACGGSCQLKCYSRCCVLGCCVLGYGAMLLAPKGDPDEPDIPTPRSYAEAITGPYSSQWKTAMDAEMASWKSTGSYFNAVPPPGANILDGMWIFRVKRPPGSRPVFKARYVARGFRQR
ncbi:unnamed protein product [Closterium sp. NIES-54]